MHSSNSIAVPALFVLFLAACNTTSSTSAAPDGGSPATTKDGGSTSSTAPLTCPDVFQCAADCTATGCEDACLANGSADAKTAVNNLLTCYQTKGCADAACLQTSCGKELDACGAQAAPAGGKPVTTVPSGSALPAELVGTWTSFNEPTQARRNYTFNADGTATLYNTGAYKMPGGCVWATITESTGTVVVENDKILGRTLTYYQTGGTQQTNQCGQQKTEPAPNSAYSYSWTIEPNGQLWLDALSPQYCIDNIGVGTCQTRLDRK